jgi:hypothetical protein
MTKGHQSDLITTTSGHLKIKSPKAKNKEIFKSKRKKKNP